MVMLDIGEGIGALVVTVPEALLGQELEISPHGRPRSRSHTVARRRHLPTGPLVAAVFPAVPVGDHDVWGPDGGLLASARVASGHVTEVDCAGGGGGPQRRTTVRRATG